MKLITPVSADDHVHGPDNAPVTLVEYGDYQCPSCGQAFPILKAIQKRLHGRLRFVFRNMPLRHAHPQAQLAAEAAEASAVQGRFWEMHDQLFEHQREFGPTFVLELARRLDLDLSRFENDLSTGRMQSRVERDVQSGIGSGVRGTPTFFINDVKYEDRWDEETLTAALLDRAGRPAHSGAKARPRR